MNRRSRWCHRVIVVVIYYHCMSVYRSIDVFYFSSSSLWFFSRSPTFIILRRFFIANASFSFFFFLYNRRTRPANWDFLFSIVTRGHSSRSSFIFYHYFFIIISIIDITIRFIIIDYIIIEFVLYHSARMRTKRKKKEEKQFRSVRCPQWKRFEARFHIMLLHRVYCPLRRGLERKKMEKIEEKMSPLSLPSRLKDDSMCDKSSL